jgi:hypothetical protein
MKKKNIEIQIGSNPCHVITRIQFPIQLVATRTIHHSQNITFDRLAFDPIGVTKHGHYFIFIVKKHLHLLSPLTNNFFQVNALVQEEVHRLRLHDMN